MPGMSRPQRVTSLFPRERETAARALVIPAKAGIQRVARTPLGSRFRGNDGKLLVAAFASCSVEPVRPTRRNFDEALLLARRLLDVAAYRARRIRRRRGLGQLQGRRPCAATRRWLAADRRSGDPPVHRGQGSGLRPGARRRHAGALPVAGMAQLPDLRSAQIAQPPVRQVDQRRFSQGGHRQGRQAHRLDRPATGQQAVPDGRHVQRRRRVSVHTADVARLAEARHRAAAGLFRPRQGAPQGCGSAEGRRPRQIGVPMIALPTLFVSHGSPMHALDAGPAGAAWAALAQKLPKPRAIVIASAHWDTAVPMLTGASRLSTIHDFSGFPAPLYALRYDAPGAPALAQRAVALLKDAGMAAGIDGSRGLDHGAWVPLRFMYPQADIPVLQVSVQTARGVEHHWQLGRALAPLAADGVLIIGSGHATHNLGDWRPAGSAALAYAGRFADWLAERPA